MRPAFSILYREIPISEARRRLPDLLRRIDEDPAVGYHITRRNKVVAVLKSPAGRPGPVVPGWTLLQPRPGRSRK